ncbi:D-ribose pyranase [Bacillus kexueae]|uniref:D-ribose pyranase n=1 Tax=Aeribacillus kexueae TaxID=2078952 RepID=UPI001FB0065A|nr:D-ribose pyranase [Bacillus kexueae]
MKKAGLLNLDLNTVLASLGHTDTIVIADCGLPIPDDVRRVDLALIKGEPSFLSVLDRVLDEMVVERCTVAQEVREANPVIDNEICKRFNHDSIQYITHEELKQQLKNAKAVVRTGEATPYANIILHAGVNFS